MLMRSLTSSVREAGGPSPRVCAWLLVASCLSACALLSNAPPLLVSGSDGCCAAPLPACERCCCSYSPLADHRLLLPLIVLPVSCQRAVTLASCSIKKTSMMVW
eukprot:365184-Chlamydomonas_euryale.AAC.10